MTEKQKSASEPIAAPELRTGKMELPEEVDTVLKIMQQVSRVRHTTPPRRPPEHDYFRIA
jgi:hypothetical protein